MFLNNDIPSKYIQSFHLPGDIQAIPYEINLKQRKLLFVSIYRPPDKKLDYFLPSKCKNIIKSKTCYKSRDGSCIDLIITS